MCLSSDYHAGRLFLARRRSHTNRFANFFPTNACRDGGERGVVEVRWDCRAGCALVVGHLKGRFIVRRGDTSDFDRLAALKDSGFDFLP